MKKYGIRFLGLVLMITVIFSCTNTYTDKNVKAVISCSVEPALLEDGKKYHYIDGQLNPIITKLGGYMVSNEAHSGTHSLLLTGKKKFGFSTSFTNNVSDKYYRISVWRKDKSKKAVLSVQGDKVYSLYIANSEAVEVAENGWEKLEVKIQIPPNLNSFKVYVWRVDADSVYFDDLRIEEVSAKEYPPYEKQEKLHVYFSDRKMQKFETKRRQAFNDGVHFSDGEWLKGVMSDETNVMPIKARLKGDWLDHLKGKKWSFRVKMRDDFTFNRMKVFSLQNPVTRYYLHEYFAHQLFDQEDVLTTRYGFIPLYINGKSLGLYAYEEHFAKQLLEYNMRREGPILKIDENLLWRQRQYEIINKEDYHFPYFEAAKVDVFGLGKTLEKPNLKKQFEIAHGLVYQYKNLKTEIDELFNLDVLAKYWALIDLTNGRHGLVWHNQRLYYNPVLCKLEPIDFDNYTDYYEEDSEPVISAFRMNKNLIGQGEFQFQKHIFTSEAFLREYLAYLEKYTDTAFINTFIRRQEADINNYEKLIKEEFEAYQFDPQYIIRNAELLKPQLQTLRDNIESGLYGKTELQVVDGQVDTSYVEGLIPFFVNGYYYKGQNNQAQIRVENYSGNGIEVLGFADENSKMLFLLEEPMSLDPYLEEDDEIIFETKYFNMARQLAFKVQDHDELLFSELALFRKNTSISPYQELLRNSDLVSCGIFHIKGDSLFVRGKQQLKEKVLVPSNKQLIFEAGAELNIIDNAAFVSHSPVQMQGTEERPIIISSSDSSANGFTVLQAGGHSEINHVIFSHLNTLDYKGWTLTGAVNFYESDVTISHCSFENNHCEDALNIIRSDFHVTKSHFEHIFADAFDSDFCTGLLDYTSFDKVGNDAIDFSTSQIHIEYCEITNINDKGISGGEGSTLWVKNTNIINCNIGAASKDLSMVELTDVNIEQCYYGLVALRKKPEYGPAIFETRKLKIQECSIKHLIELNSVLSLNGRKIEGIEEKVAERFY